MVSTQESYLSLQSACSVGDYKSPVTIKDLFSILIFLESFLNNVQIQNL